MDGVIDAIFWCLWMGIEIFGGRWMYCGRFGIGVDGVGEEVVGGIGGIKIGGIKNVYPKYSQNTIQQVFSHPSIPPPLRINFYYISIIY